MKMEEKYLEILKKEIKNIDNGKSKLNPLKLLTLSLLSMRRQFSVYLYEGGHKVGEILSEFLKIESISESMKKIMEILGYNTSVDEKGSKYIISVDGENTEHLFFERGVLAGYFSKNVPEGKRVLVSEENGKILVEILDEEELIKRVFSV